MRSLPRPPRRLIPAGADRRSTGYRGGCGAAQHAPYARRGVHPRTARNSVQHPQRVLHVCRLPYGGAGPVIRDITVCPPDNVNAPAKRMLSGCGNKVLIRPRKAGLTLRTDGAENRIYTDRIGRTVVSRQL